MSGLDGHDDGHDHDPDELEDLTDVVRQARRGLRSDVQELVDMLPFGELLVPLAEDIDDAPEGERIEIEKDLTFRPHMVLDEEHNMYCVAFTRPEFMETMREELGWTTAGAELKFCSVPAQFVFDMALQVIDGEEVLGLVINAGTDDELMLRRDEVGSLAQGQALPLVGYVGELPESADEQTRVVEHAEPLPEALHAALQEAVAAHAELSSAEVQVTFNPERDREPHPTITLRLARHDVDRHALAESVMERVAPHVPPPGYVDVLFRDPAN
jgi:hypothetical protein